MLIRGGLTVWLIKLFCFLPWTAASYSGLYFFFFASVFIEISQWVRENVFSCNIVIVLSSCGWKRVKMLIQAAKTALKHFEPATCGYRVNSTHHPWNKNIHSITLWIGVHLFPSLYKMTFLNLLIFCYRWSWCVWWASCWSSTWRRSMRSSSLMWRPRLWALASWEGW